MDSTQKEELRKDIAADRVINEVGKKLFDRLPSPTLATEAKKKVSLTEKEILVIRFCLDTQIVRTDKLLSRFNWDELLKD